MCECYFSIYFIFILPVGVQRCERVFLLSRIQNSNWSGSLTETLEQTSSQIEFRPKEKKQNT